MAEQSAPRRTPTAARREASSAREVASYLVGLRPVLNTATEARRTWVRRIGILMEDARQGNPAQIAQSAASIGRDHIAAFRNSRSRLDSLKPTRECTECHRAITLWIEKLAAACDVLISVGANGDLTRIRETQHLLAESRAHAHQFNGEYARLVGELRARVAASAASRPRAARVAPRAGRP